MWVGFVEETSTAPKFRTEANVEGIFFDVKSAAELCLMALHLKAFSQ